MDLVFLCCKLGFLSVAVDSFETTSLATGCTLVKMNGLPSPVLCGFMLSLVCQMGTSSGDPRSRNDYAMPCLPLSTCRDEKDLHIFSGGRLTTVFGHFLFFYPFPFAPEDVEEKRYQHSSVSP